MLDMEQPATVGALSVTSEAITRIFVLVVLYETSPEESPTLQSLDSQQSCNRIDLHTAIYDNSPKRQATCYRDFEYVHDPDNGGLAAAYEWALTRSREKGIGWLLLLDQDSMIPPDFLAELSRTISQAESDSRVVAIVPTVKSGDAILSPSRVKFGRTVPLNGTTSEPGIEITAVNSGVTVRTSFLSEIGGFNKEYWLDHLDYWLFRQIYKRGKSVVVSRSVIQHDLSVRNYRQNISAQRYRSILNAEAKFTVEERPRLELPIYISRLFLRSVKQVIVLRSAELAGMTLKKASEVLKLSVRKSVTS
jgi:GT2 family glycosyltransferase